MRGGLPLRTEEDFTCVMKRAVSDSSLKRGTRASWCVHSARRDCATLSEMLLKTLKTTPDSCEGSADNTAFRFGFEKLPIDAQKRV